MNNNRKIYGFFLLLTILGTLIVVHQFFTAKEEIQTVLENSSPVAQTKRIVCISDTHGKHEQLKIPTGDILIHLGDSTTKGKDFDKFLKWFSGQPHEHKILILGTEEANSTNLNEPSKEITEELKRSPQIHVLQDESKVIAGIKFFGSSRQGQWKSKGFYKEPSELEKLWSQIPKDVQVLLTHTPSFGPFKDEILLKQVFKIQPMLHFFGQIHSGKNGELYTSYLAGTQHPETVFIKTSICDENNKIVNKAIVVDIHH
jgi:predicted MPP superfamily phosphohydrolase